MIANGGALSTVPTNSTALAPNLVDSAPDQIPQKNIVTVIGSTSNPDSVMLALNPYPLADEVWTNSGRKASTEYSPIPKMKATRLAVQTAGARIIFMSISGCSARNSTAAQDAASTMVARTSSRTRGETQPQSGASLTATSNA